VFVCTHNSARSPLAAAIWHQHSPIPAVSAGTDPADRVHPRAIRIGRRHGVRLDHATSHVHDVVHHSDLVIAVCDNAHEHLATHLALPRSTVKRHLHWSVPDPATTDTDRAFETTYADLLTRISRLAPAVGPPTT
jgi:protein-tyrosine-phosphatase